MNSTTKNDSIAARRLAHLKALARLAEATGMRAPVDGLKLWRQLRRIENEAHAAATAQCNGETYQGQPYREEAAWEAFCNRIAGKVAKAFGGRLPEGFRFNTDPRGYALKIRGPEAGDPGAFIPEGMEKDWGSNGLLAAEITEG